MKKLIIATILSLVIGSGIAYASNGKNQSAQTSNRPGHSMIHATAHTPQGFQHSR